MQFRVLDFFLPQTKNIFFPILVEKTFKISGKGLSILNSKECGKEMELSKTRKRDIKERIR
jgi:formate-dependent phosphoribosylglycinamide formyltransferase (GAR transformylase)